MLLSNVTRGLQEKTRALFGSSGSALSLCHREVTLTGREGLDGYIFSSVLFFPLVQTAHKVISLSMLMLLCAIDC